MKAAVAITDVSGGHCTLPYRPTARGMRTCKSTLRAPAPPGSYSRRSHRREVGTCYGQTLADSQATLVTAASADTCAIHALQSGSRHVTACRVHPAFDPWVLLGGNMIKTPGVTGWR